MRKGGHHHGKAGEQTGAGLDGTDDAAGAALALVMYLAERLFDASPDEAQAVLDEISRLYDGAGDEDMRWLMQAFEGVQALCAERGIVLVLKG